jgi:hypothetical protein
VTPTDDASTIRRPDILVGERTTVGTTSHAPALDDRRAAPLGRAFDGACIALLVVGGGLRLRQYLAHRALWRDELLVVSSIVHRSYSGLLKPLDYSQGAPVGWLWIEKAAVDLFGNHDQVLRLVPLLLSLGSLVLFSLLVRRWLSGLASVVACTLFAFAPNLINYATQVKQYGGDVFFVLVVVVMTTRVIDKPSARRIVFWTLASVVAMWCSYAAIVALAGCSLVLVARLMFTTRSWKTILSVLAAGVAFVVSLSIEYFANVQTVSKNKVIADYFNSRGLPPRPFSISGDATWLWHALRFFMTNPAEFGRPTLALILVIIGSVVFVARRGPTALVVFAPFAAAILASLLHTYPLYERVSLFCAPMVFIALASLVDLGLPARLAPVAIAAFVSVVVVTSVSVKNSVSIARSPSEITDSEGPFAFAAAHWQPGDALLVERTWAWPAYDYYGPQYGLRAVGRFAMASKPGPCLVGAEVGRLQKYRRVWFVLTHRISSQPMNRNEIYRSYFSAVGPLEAAFNGYGNSGAYLYKVDKVPRAVRPLPAWVENPCIAVRLDAPPLRTG